MIHELILQLLCKPSVNFYTKALRERLHPSEQKLLERVLSISDNYSTILAFINRYVWSNNRSQVSKSYSTDDDGRLGIADWQIDHGAMSGSDEHSNTGTELQPGIYLQAFCLALDKGLDSYRNDVVLLESKALHDVESVPFTKVVSVAEKYAELFQVLIGITNQIEVRNIHGCALLSYLYTQMFSGSTTVANAIQFIFRECQLVFMDQLSHWLLLGHLFDLHHEFFISYDGLDAGCSTMDTTDFGVGLSLNDGQLANKSSDAFLSCSNYIIRSDMLPMYIPQSVATKVLYIGKMIMLFRMDPREATKMGCDVKAPKLSVWGDKEEEYFGKLRAVCADEAFDKIRFEKTVAEIHSTVTECTWQYFVVDTKLIEEISVMKDFFLLGRGELFLEFLYKTDGIRQKLFSRSDVEQNCREAFNLAARMYTDESTLKKFSIHFNVEESYGSDIDLFKERDGWWHTLSLKYDIKWPMHLIFKSSVLRDYNKLFNVLMRVKKAQRDLDEIWFDHKQSKTTFCGTISTRVWQLRNNLIFMVNNLQYYLQFDVLECQYSKLQEKLQASKDFDEILHAHTVFQANIISQSFLWTSETHNDDVGGEPRVLSQMLPVNRTLLSLLQLADRFCKTVNDLSVDEKALNKIRKEFEKTITILLEYMESMQDHPSGANVSKLCLRLNYNGWFTKTLHVSSGLDMS